MSYALLAPVEESPTIYSVFLQENPKEGKSEKDQQAVMMVPSTASATSVVYGANKKNAQLNKKTVEKKKDKQYTLEDALQQVIMCVFMLRMKAINLVMCTVQVH